MVTILDNTSGENYFDTRALADYVVIARETVAMILLNQVCPYIFYLSLSMDNITPINQFAAPTGTQLEPPKSSKPILTPGYELCPSLISMVQEQSFSG